MRIGDYSITLDSNYSSKESQIVQIESENSANRTDSARVGVSNFNYSKDEVEFKKKVVNSILDKISTFERNYNREQESYSESNLFGVSRGRVFDMLDSASENSSILFRERVDEEQMVNFLAKGLIQSDRGEIEFNIELNLSRKFIGDNSLYINFADPLVINFDSPTATFSSKTFRFDIDNDGFKEQLRALNSGSGILALDRDRDGEITKGSELFGADSGDGFEELREFDEDGNGWIDENDSIFNKLRVFTFDENGESQLFALGEVGVGAIYLESATTKYDIKDNSNRELGKLKESSLFLKESGDVGVVQAIDFAIDKFVDIKDNLRVAEFGDIDLNSLTEGFIFEALEEFEFSENQFVRDSIKDERIENGEYSLVEIKSEEVTTEKVSKKPKNRAVESTIELKDYSYLAVKSKLKDSYTSSDSYNLAKTSKDIETLKSKQSEFKTQLTQLEARLEIAKQMQDGRKESYLEDNIVKTKSEISNLDTYIISLMQRELDMMA